MSIKIDTVKELQILLENKKILSVSVDNDTSSVHFLLDGFTLSVRSFLIEGIAHLDITGKTNKE